MSAERDAAIVFDCGATNVRAVAINLRGDILASESFPNNTRPDPFYPSYRIWDVKEIWEKMCAASGKVVAALGAERIAGVTVTTFGVDGTFFDTSGKMLYPVISWQCERTAPVMENIGKYIPVSELYRECGVLPFNFNTINKLVWFRENRPEIIEKNPRFLFISSIFSFFLTGEMMNDMTMLGTSMLTDIGKRGISGRIMKNIGVDPGVFGEIAEPGTITGFVNREASIQTGLPQGIPVVATGHDTQFAIFGSGASLDEPVLSSGTWEILMVRSSAYRSGNEELAHGITTELDPEPGLYNIGNQWLASGILEWCRKTLFSDLKDDVYEKMISGAEKVPRGSNGVKVIPNFYEELGNTRGGQITGLSLGTTRDEIYRAMLEALCERLSQGKKALEHAGSFRAGSILCVGGGSRNRLWNRMRAEYTGIPIRVINRTETTVLGASMFVQAAAGNAATPTEARNQVDYRIEIFEP